MAARAQLRQVIRGNLLRVQDSINRAAQGRSIRLVCITKYARLEWAEALLEAGATELGENLLPSAAERFSELTASGRRFTRHLVGAQQSRKLRLIPGNFDCYQALDRTDDADELQRRLATQGAAGGLDVLLQVNPGGEQQKRGISTAMLQPLLEHVLESCPLLKLRGLMAIPPGPGAYSSAAEFERATRSHFSGLRQLFDRICGAGGPCSGVTAWDTLSMGMSQDYTWAIEEGATMVRVGSALFEGVEG